MSNTNDLIRRGDAIDAVYARIKQIGFEENVDVLSIRQAVREVPPAQITQTNTFNALKALPSAEPTLYGYNIEHLELIARVLQKEDLPPERIVEVLTDIGRIVAIVNDEFEEALRKAVEQCKI